VQLAGLVAAAAVPAAIRQASPAKRVIVVRFGSKVIGSSVGLRGTLSHALSNARQRASDAVGKTSVAA
jgi:hypothetical protein